MDKPRNGFTLMEVLIALGIVAILAVVTFILIAPGAGKARDTRRKVELTQVGRVIATRSYIPESGSGDYALSAIIDDFKNKYPQYASYIPPLPTGDYRYLINSETKKCALYTNLENASEPITLPGISTTTLGGGTGVFEATSTGWNNTNKFFQVAN